MARRKQQAGVALTPEERAVLAEYHSKYYRQKKGLHISADRLDDWEDRAARQGLSFSKWVQERVDEAIHGHEEDKRALREENQRLRDEIGSLRGVSGNLAVENSKLQARLEEMQSQVMEVLDKAIELTGYPG